MVGRDFDSSNVRICTPAKVFREISVLQMSKFLNAVMPAKTAPL
ncbi:17014_t:CDS:2 [Rhizophagus irregularis]|nr:17014_t:CDS:2 [Rhizophagus irregularis]